LYVAVKPRKEMLVGGRPLKCIFALSELPLSAAIALISALMKFNEYSICIAVITMEYEITNNVH